MGKAARKHQRPLKKISKRLDVIERQIVALHQRGDVHYDHLTTLYTILRGKS